MTIKQREVAGIGRAKSRSYRYVAAPLPKVDAYAKVTGRPVKITCTREEVFLTPRGRLPVKMWIKQVTNVLTMLAQEGEQAMLVVGGTDLYPNMKRCQLTPPVVIGLRSVAALKGTSDSSDLMLPGAVLGRVDDMLIICGVNVYPSALKKVLMKAFHEIVWTTLGADVSLPPPIHRP